MVVPTDLSYVERAWTGVETSFSTGMRAKAVSHVKVTYLKAGVVTTLTDGVHLTLSKAAGTDLISAVPLAMPAALGTVCFERITPATQDTEFSDVGMPPASVHTDLHDRAAMRDAELRRLVLAAIASIATHIADPTIAPYAVRVDAAQDFSAEQQRQALVNLGLPPIGPGDTSHTDGWMGIEYQLQPLANAGFEAKYEGLIWPAFQTDTYLAISRVWGEGYEQGMNLFLYAVNDGAALWAGNPLGDGGVCPIVTVANANVDDASIFAGNFISRTNGGGLTGIHNVCVEFDWMVADGDAVSASSIAIPLNAFGAQCPTGIQFGGIGGGSFNNGIVFYGIDSVAVCAGVGTAMGSLIATANATYTAGAIQVNYGQVIRFYDNANSDFGYIYNPFGTMTFVPGDEAAFDFRNPANSASLFYVNAQVGAELNGLADLSSLGLVCRTVSATHDFEARTLTAPAAGLSINNPQGIAGNPTFALANDLAALEALSGTGIAQRTGSDAWSLLSTTGSGAVVLGTSPTFTTSLTISATGSTDGRFNVVSVNGNSTFALYDTVSGGVLQYVVDGTFFHAAANTGGSWAGTLYSMTAAGLGTYEFDLHVKGEAGFGTAAVGSAWVAIAAGTTAHSQMNLPGGAAPTSPNDGDVWRVGAQLFMRDGGATKSVTFA